MKDIHITLPDEAYETLKKTAADLGTSMSDIVATLLIRIDPARIHGMKGEKVKYGNIL